MRAVFLPRDMFPILRLEVISPGALSNSMTIEKMALQDNLRVSDLIEIRL